MRPDSSAAPAVGSTRRWRTPPGSPMCVPSIRTPLCSLTSRGGASPRRTVPMASRSGRTKSSRNSEKWVRMYSSRDAYDPTVRFGGGSAPPHRSSSVRGSSGSARPRAALSLAAAAAAERETAPLAAAPGSGEAVPERGSGEAAPDRGRPCALIEETSRLASGATVCEASYGRARRTASPFSARCRKGRSAAARSDGSASTARANEIHAARRSSLRRSERGPSCACNSRAQWAATSRH
mmetsp:Transcript_17199/g.57884  ORF Transcript_17199/g.57884 Transcript_17199/m.57884 type:complete len:238 (-) Transcript_17199:317-1030(-)